MDFVLRCNDLKCRTHLTEQAIVTTCSHVFCRQCAGSTGLSQGSNLTRQCPACGTSLVNPDDVVVAALNPSEDYKTSILSGLSPSIIMECASRGLGFYSYQSSQEIIYQEHLAKSLTEKYTTLNQQMDQLIHDANSQIKALQDKLQAMQADQANLEQKNHELVSAFREKSKAQQQLQKLYQSLKAQVMASHVANAAGDEAEYALQHTVRPDRFVDKLSGTRTGTANFSQATAPPRRGGSGLPGFHNREGSGSSGSAGQPGGRFGLGNAQPKTHGMGVRGFNGYSAPTGTPSQQQLPSRLPVLGGARLNPYLAADAGANYQPSPSSRLLRGGRQNMDGFGAGTKSSKRR